MEMRRSVVVVVVGPRVGAHAAGYVARPPPHAGTPQSVMAAPQYAPSSMTHVCQFKIQAVAADSAPGGWPADPKQMKTAFWPNVVAHVPSSASQGNCKSPRRPNRAAVLFV